MEDPRYNIIPPKVPRCTAWPQPPRGGRCTHMYTTRYPRMSKYHAPLMKGHTHTCDAHFVKPIAPVRIVHGHVSILLCWSKLPTWSPRSVFNRCILLLVRVILLHPPWNMTDQVAAAACPQRRTLPPFRHENTAKRTGGCKQQPYQRRKSDPLAQSALAPKARAPKPFGDR